MKVWRFQLWEDYQYKHALFEGINFKNDWVVISDGQLNIKSGYAWDGNTPKFYVFGLFTVGIPDGALRFGRPWTWGVSLVHDVLVQFRHDIPLSKKQVTQIFSDQLTEVKWPLRRVWVWAVDKYGPQDFKVAD